ncbi:SDR family oxidoreductase [Flavobacterium sp. ASW18X]|uniref:SDR family oxidoreductase n=1 Tax=Flavobacterium sp. ASW18X TaxID=2572595 RepID=UPI0010AEE1A1|nr:SDR family oxidoreductase [Flavobacterium sp. ASW18X]TKD66011.1 SDR family oxidoreductase [Flavobacterium sp. ASW18X]
MERILVAGANGTTGKQVVEILNNTEGYAPVAMVRKESQMEQFKSKNIDTVLGDLENDLSHAVQNIDKVIFAAGSGGKKVVAVDQEGAKNLIREAEKANVKKFVMLSSMGADAPEKAEKLQDYLKAKHNADEFLKQSKVPYAIVRPGTLNNESAKGTIKIGDSLEKKGEITRADVANTLVSSLRESTTTNKTYEILQGDLKIDEALKQI